MTERAHDMKREQRDRQPRQNAMDGLGRLVPAMADGQVRPGNDAKDQSRHLDFCGRNEKPSRDRAED
jgi:hypothetical protein